MACLDASACIAIFFLLSSEEVTENKAFKGAMKNTSSYSLCHTSDLLQGRPALQVVDVN